MFVKYKSMSINNIVISCLAVLFFFTYNSKAKGVQLGLIDNDTMVYVKSIQEFSLFDKLYLQISSKGEVNGEIILADNFMKFQNFNDRDNQVCPCIKINSNTWECRATQKGFMRRKFRISVNDKRILFYHRKIWRKYRKLTVLELESLSLI